MAMSLSSSTARWAAAPSLARGGAAASRRVVAPARGVRLVVRAEAKDPNDIGINFGGSGASGDKQDAAKKALQDALSGSFGGKDILEAYDSQPPSGGNGGSGGSGGFGGFGGWDWNEFGDNMRKSFGGFFTAILTFLSFGGIIFAISFFKPMCRLIVSLLRKMLMLDGPGRTPVPATAAPLVSEDGEELSAAEASVVSKFAEADDDFFGGDEDEE